jgi:glycosyltransferase involved in cell wall biosynthesis
MVLGEAVKLFSKGLENPSKIVPFIKHTYQSGRFEQELAGHHVDGIYQPDSEPRYNALLHLPMWRVFATKSELRKRVNAVEAQRWIRVFNELAFEVDVYPQKNSPRNSIVRKGPTPDNLAKYDVIFGTGEEFLNSVQSASDDTLLLGLTGSEPWRNRVPSYLSRLSNLHHRKDSVYTSYRNGPIGFTTHSFVDGLFTVGDERTKSNYEDEYPSQVIKRIPMSHPPSDEYDVSKRDYESARNNFVYFGGNGPVLKGLDVTLDAFSNINDVDLFVCGPTDKERYEQFARIYEHELNNVKNIENVGWVELFSEKYQNIIDNCGFLIYPSSTEGGAPCGAVISMMWHGMVPVVSTSSWADVGNLGIQLENCSPESIRNTVTDASSISSSRLCSWSQEVYEYARSTHNRQAVQSKIKYQLRKMLEETGFETMKSYTT